MLSCTEHQECRTKPSNSISCRLLEPPQTPFQCQGFQERSGTAWSERGQSLDSFRRLLPLFLNGLFSNCGLEGSKSSLTCNAASACRCLLQAPKLPNPGRQNQNKAFRGACGLKRSAWKQAAERVTPTSSTQEQKGQQSLKNICHHRGVRAPWLAVLWLFCCSTTLL